MLLADLLTARRFFAGAWRVVQSVAILTIPLERLLIALLSLHSV